MGKAEVSPLGGGVRPRNISGDVSGGRLLLCKFPEVLTWRCLSLGGGGGVTGAQRHRCVQEQ